MKSYNRKFFDLWRKDESFNVVKRLAFFCAMRSGRWSDELCNLVQTNDFEALCNFDINYTVLDRDVPIRELQYARQCLAFFSKNSDLEICDTEAAMLESFINSEKKCRRTNQTWSSWFQSGTLWTREDGIIHAVSRKITEILGPCPDLSSLDISFGPGSSVGVENHTAARFKLDATPTCSSLMHEALNSDMRADLPAYWSAHKQSYRVVKGKLSGVPKNAKTKRSVIVESAICTMYQKGYGSAIRNRLKLAGLDIRQGQMRNRELALLGSLNGTIVTVDVKNASNTEALLPVFHLLDDDWFDGMNAVRTDEVEYKKNQTFKLEMFSSMGNGFTFELETLIFYAIALVVCERMSADTSLVSVYGDDIIVPVECYENLCSALKLFGFDVNYDKTHYSGFFRESCGVDYYFGKNIRPFYIKDRFTNARLVGLLNFDLRNNNLFYEIRNDLIQMLPVSQVNWGPDGFGDGHLITDDLDINYKNPKVQTVKQQYKHGTLNGYTFDTFRKAPEKVLDKCDIGDSLLPLYNIYTAPSLREIKKLKSGLVFDVYGLSHVNSENITVEFYVDNMNPREEHDPFVIRGGWRSQKIPIYMLP